MVSCGVTEQYLLSSNTSYSLYLMFEDVLITALRYIIICCMVHKIGGSVQPRYISLMHLKLGAAVRDLRTSSRQNWIRRTSRQAAACR
jgi:hypothetical protein